MMVITLYEFIMIMFTQSNKKLLTVSLLSASLWFLSVFVKHDNVYSL